MSDSENWEPEPTTLRDGEAADDSHAEARYPVTLDAWFDLTAFQRDALEAIAHIEQRPAECYGLAIKRALEARYDEKVNHGRLYPNLDDLVDRGLVQKGRLDRRTNEYLLTSEAWTLLEERADSLAAVVVTEAER